MRKCLDLFDKLFHWLSAIAFILVSLCVLIQVVARYTPAFSTPWTDEMTRLFFMYTVMLAAPMALKYKEYALIDILTVKLKNAAVHVHQILVYILIGVMSFVGAHQSALFFKTGLRTVSTSLKINMGVFYFVPVGIFVLTLIYCILGIITELMSFKKEAQ